MSNNLELQRLDCNCNDCTFMVRNLEKHKESLVRHHKWQLDYFNTIKNNLLNKAKQWKERGYPDKEKTLTDMANKMKFQFDRLEASINYGRCTKFNKDVSFIPNHCQVDTQKCFIHRKDI